MALPLRLLASLLLGSSLWAVEASVLEVLPVVSDGDHIYGIGQQLRISVRFSEPVDLGAVSADPADFPVLVLPVASNGDHATEIMREAVYQSGDLSTTLVFAYTVAAGDWAQDLDFANLNALDLKAGFIDTVATGNPATLTLPSGAAGSLAASHIAFDTLAPTVASLTSVGNTGFPYGVPFYLAVNFSESVQLVGGTGIRLALNTGGTATWSAGGDGSGTAILLTNTPVAPEAALAVDAASTSALTLLPGTTLTDLAGNAAVLTLPVPGEEHSLSASAVLQVPVGGALHKPIAATIANGNDSTGGCGAGGAGLVLAGALSLLARRRRH